MSIADLKNAKKVVGAKQTVKAVEKGLAAIVYLANDADQRLLLPVTEVCIREKIAVDNSLSMLELGKACGIEVGAAAVACLK
ncbi:50S ribosomal protein L7ae [Anaerosporomusa subterranea]|uniref:50S ribosomal protein L7ae n=1 Tax=Anaerosporomusa subterranea TaxID=1794912 RepID=A0A154BUS9_ANASB|nr:ribosomal L7Ae/L30e/S12e/Gadd45 family protein [Anaerosporomusa subterranea]KYZ77691.1 50S ribosomal protein L7ae [Anaerosporomusa subterranea]